MLGLLFLIGLLVAKKFPKPSILEKKEKLKTYLFSNWTIRIFMESYLNLCLFSLLNLYEMRWDLEFEAIKTSNVISILVFMSTLIVPVVLFVYFIRNRSRWEDEVFQSKTEAWFEGVRHDEKHHKALLIWQFIFFLRRMVLCLTLVLWHEVFWGQVFFQYVISVGLVIIIRYLKPLDSRFANNIATFNECFIVLILYTLMYFTEFVKSPVIRNEWGSVYISILFIFTFIHFSFIIYESVRSSFLRMRYYWRWRK